MSLADYPFPSFPIASTSANLSILHDCNFSKNFQLVPDGFVSTMGMHSRIGFDFSELLVALKFDFPTVLAQCTLHCPFILMFLFPCPSLCSLVP